MFQDLWRKAIKQQILLLRMEKENQRIVGRYLYNAFKFCPFVTRIIHQSTKNNLRSVAWNLTTAAWFQAASLHYKLGKVVKFLCQLMGDFFRPGFLNTSATVPDRSSIREAVGLGIPRSKRGEAWQLMAKMSKTKPPPADKFPSLSMVFKPHRATLILTMHICSSLTRIWSRSSPHTNMQSWSTWDALSLPIPTSVEPLVLVSWDFSICWKHTGGGSLNTCLQL